MAETTIQLLRGADTIGGTCIKIKHGADYILLDYGMPLMASGGGELDPAAVRSPSQDNGILLDVLGEDNSRPLAILISHAHPDHYGLVDYAIDDVPIYVSRQTEALIQVGNIFYGESMRVVRVGDVNLYEQEKEFCIGPFSIYAYPMDHSAFGASSLLITVDGKRIFYTGDFRGHGRAEGYLPARMIERLRGCDAMLMEGTTMDDGHPEIIPSEEAVEDEIVRRCRENEAPMMVAGSGSNIDRLVSLYEAAGRANRELVIDLYQLYMLDQLRAFDATLPPIEGDHLRVYYAKNQIDTIKAKIGDHWLFKYKDRHINADKLDPVNKRYIFRLSNFYTGHLAQYYLDRGVQPQLVYSMWKGYMEKQPAFRKLEEQIGVKWEYVHTSGHAYLGYLKHITSAVEPQRLVPIHTLRSEEFPQHFDNVKIVPNGGTITL